ncbi:hypothetical protein CLHUN_28660 [Ruminiclostridium hungatei]|uniref:DUF4085 family protein n=1 Tax=Ruminiclostridium hungatei TaxID=48256 RepID=A0A1V4SHH0_RUMHU|nr:DUF4085 family protein [Ruminiclostridium hungatei]OPX43318.1 hypothetical protein CLHUN_28660 [Ruminiclostridium hungatei]
MRYFTKEWYELCQKTGAHMLLEETAEAEHFSEQYFKQTYDQKLNEWLSLEEEVASVPFEAVFPAQMEIVDESLSEEELEAFREEYRLKLEEARERFNSREPFSREKESRLFYEGFIQQLEYAGKLLPGQILSQIADLRVFVLDKASRQVIEAVTRFCEENRRVVETAGKAYWEYYEKALQLLEEAEKKVFKSIHFHDCTVKEVKQTGKSFSIVFDNSGGFTGIKEMTLENYTLINQEGLLEEAWWLYEEVYRWEQQYEIHTLLQSKDLKLIELTVRAEHISFK